METSLNNFIYLLSLADSSAISVTNNAQLTRLGAGLVARVRRMLADSGSLFKHACGQLLDQGQRPEAEAEGLQAQQVVAIRALAACRHLRSDGLQHDRQAFIDLLDHRH